AREPFTHSNLGDAECLCNGTLRPTEVAEFEGAPPLLFPVWAIHFRAHARIIKELNFSMQRSVGSLAAQDPLRDVPDSPPNIPPQPPCPAQPFPLARTTIPNQTPTRPQSTPCLQVVDRIPDDIRPPDVHPKIAHRPLVEQRLRLGARARRP